MTPLEAAKALSARGFTPWEDSCHLTCELCGADFAEDDPAHSPDCPWIAMPAIVAALEAAQGATNDAQCWAGSPAGNMPRDMEWVQIPLASYEVLQAALKGNSAP